MSELYNSLCITGVAKTICDVAGIGAPDKAEPSIELICNRAKTIFKGKNADRVFMYNPDAVALWLFQKYTAMFEKAFACSDLQIPLLSVMPAVTPVCFASMYTGAKPAVHGIQKYAKPVLQTDTVFDAFLRAGKKCAIVAITPCSIAHIFLERDMDYFFYDSVEECTKKAMELVEEDGHDLIVLYHGNYDEEMHRSSPESQASLAQLKANIEMFATLVKHLETHWARHRTMVGFCPDHGCHEIDDGLGSHGLDMPEDMNVIHFYRFIGG